MAVRLASVIIPTKPARSIDTRTWAWICSRPTDAILAVFAMLLALYFTIYLGSGAWAMPTDYSPNLGEIHHG